MKVEFRLLAQRLLAGSGKGIRSSEAIDNGKGSENGIFLVGLKTLRYVSRFDDTSRMSCSQFFAFVKVHIALSQPVSR